MDVFGPLRHSKRDASNRAARLASRYFFHLREIQFHRRRAPENRYRNLQRRAVGIHFLHHARKIRKRPFADTHFLAAIKRQFRLGFLRRGGRAVQNVLHFFFGQRRRRLPAANESRHARCRTHHVPGVIVHIHFHQHVARITHPRRNHFLAAAHFHHRFRRNNDLPDLVGQPERRHAAFKALFYFLLESRVGVHDVPLLRRGHRPRRGFVVPFRHFWRSV